MATKRPNSEANRPGLGPAITTSTWISLGARLSAFAAVLLWSAGTWRWWEAWVVIMLWTSYAVITVIFLARHDPALLAERLKTSPVQKGQKDWDKVLMVFMMMAGLGLYIVPGLDVMRFGWSQPLPAWVEIIAMVFHVPGFIFLVWVMHTNTYLAPVVKIDRGRGHHVITTGPYALVRHPMYSAVIYLVFTVPLALGSRYGLIPAVFVVLLLVLRTSLEDRVLMDELAGYAEYAEKTRYKLIPRVW